MSAQLPAPDVNDGAPVDAPVEVQGNAQVGQHVVATRALGAGEVIADLAGAQRVSTATRYTVQIGEHAHIDGLWQFTFLNHACDPNVLLDTGTLQLRAARDIATGEELRYFYPSTEWQMAEPVICQCGATACLGAISGAADLPAGVLDRYALNAHIERLRRALPTPSDR